MHSEPGDWFLGDVTLDVTERFTLVNPVAIAASDTARWDKIEDAKILFPNRGLVSWFEAPAGLGKRTLVEFQADKDSGADDSNPHKFRIRSAGRCVEVISVPDWTETRLREALTNEGIPLRQPPVGRVMLKLSSTRWFGPLDLIEAGSGRWHLASKSELEAVPVFENEPAPITQLTIAGFSRQIIFTGGTELMAARIANWQSDAEVLRSVIRRLQRFDSAFLADMGVTATVLDSCFETIANTKQLFSQLPIEQARAERLKKIRSDLHLTSALVGDIVTELVRLEDVRASISKQTTTTSGGVALPDESHKEESRTFPHASESAFAERTSACVLQPIIAPECLIAQDLRTVSETLSREFLRLGIATDSVLALLAALVAGLRPICTGDAGPDALRAVARAAFGGNAWWIPVSPITTSLRDILTPASGASQPVLGGLGDVLECARHNPDALVLAVLDGIDLAPAEFFLPSLIQYSDDPADLSGGRVPVLRGDGFGVGEWPPNALLAITITGATSSLPIPRRLCGQAPLFGFRWSTIADSTLPITTPVRIPLQLWDATREAAERVDLRPEFAVANVSPPVQRSATRLYKTAVALGGRPADAGQMVLKHVITPALAASGGTLPAGSSAAAAEYFDLAKALIANTPQ